MILGDRPSNQSSYFDRQHHNPFPFFSLFFKTFGPFCTTLQKNSPYYLVSKKNKPMARQSLREVSQFLD
jgi:hypothetical protein